MGPATANGAIIWIVIAIAAAASAYAQNAASIPSGAAKVLPKGVDPESFSRLPPLKGADLDEEGMRVYDTLAGGPDKEGGCDGSAA